MMHQIQTPDPHRKPFCRVRTRQRQRMGSLYPIVMGVSALVACLAVAGLEMSRVAGHANQQLREQVEARRMAQAGLDYWQRQYNAQVLSDPTAPLNVQLDARYGFSVSAIMSPLGVNPQGAAQVTSVGTAGDAIQRLIARYEARPTLYEGFRCALQSNTASITHTSSTVDANHWSIARQDTSSSSSTIRMDAMTCNAFTGTLSNFRQRRVASIPWNMSMGSFNATDTSYPGAPYLNNTQAVTIQPPRGGEQLLSNPNFATNTSSWYSNSSATLMHDTTQGYNSSRSGRMINRLSGNDAPVQEVSRFLVRGANYSAQAFVRPDSAASFRIRLTYTYSNPTTVNSVESAAVKLNSGQWTNLDYNWTFGGTSTPPTKVELGIVSDTPVNFNFDSVSLYNLSRNSGIAYIQNTVLSDTYNPFSINNASPAASGIYIVDCRNSNARVENCRIRSTLVFTNCTGVDLQGGIVWDVPNQNFPAIIANASITDNTTLDTLGGNSLRESDVSFNVNPVHTPFGGASDSDFSDVYSCFINGAIFSTGSVSLGNSNTSRGKIRWLTGPILARNTLSIQYSTKSIGFDSNMILNPPPGFYPAFTPMRLIPSSIDEASPSSQLK